MVAPNEKPAEAAPVAKLAAKVAHELNNPLDAVLRFVSLAQRKARSGEYADLDRHLADAQFGLQRMAEILRELMELGRQTNDAVARSRRVALEMHIAHAVRMAAPQAQPRRISVEVDNRLPAHVAPAYDLRLSQVLANLLKNALQAAPARSTVRLAVSLRSPDRIAITVEDAGPGIPAEILPQLFTPFVTSKPRGAGHGLGLAISRELVASLGGTLTIENQSLAGCIARILLPIS